MSAARRVFGALGPPLVGQMRLAAIEVREPLSREAQLRSMLVRGHLLTCPELFYRRKSYTARTPGQVVKLDQV